MKEWDYAQTKVAEASIGKEASKMVEQGIKQAIIDNAVVKSHDLWRSVKVTPYLGNLRLFAIQPTVNRYGYILEHGIKGKRTGHTRKRGSIFYSVKEHSMMLQGKPFITQGIEDSGAFEYLFEEIGKLRMEEISLAFKQTPIKPK